MKVTGLWHGIVSHSRIAAREIRSMLHGGRRFLLLKCRAIASHGRLNCCPATMNNDEPLPTPPETESAASPTGADAEAAAAQTKLAELEARHAEMADAYLRSKAEAENTRRRADEEISKARKYAVEGFADSLLPVKDSLEAAIAIPAATPEQLLEGVHATLRQLSAALERNKVLEISPAAGEKFDPHRHQAISVVPAEQEANTVVAVLQKGYAITDRVLRPALVTVAAAR
jgi:molecular chaperone GrpE